VSLSASSIEELVAWCASSEALADVRAKARGDFFGYDEPGTVKYMPQAGEVNARERRFLGWFCFNFRLPDGRRPAEMAADAFLTGQGLASALKSIQQARYVTAIATLVRPGKGVYLQIQDEEFEVDSRILSQALRRDDVLCAHIVPVGRGRWLVCPGWLVWPTRFGPGVRSRLKKFQLDPIQVERFLQRRATPQEDRPKIEYPKDKTLEEAVARITEAARSEGKDKLVKPVEEWKKLVLSHMKANDNMSFSKDIMKWVGNVASLDELNKWLALAMNIWNATPQPDREGKTAYELSREEVVLDELDDQSK
jgi:hypothetical protein